MPAGTDRCPRRNSLYVNGIEILRLSDVSVACQCAWTFRLGHDSPLACGSWLIYQGGLPRHGISRCRPTHGRADLALLQRGLRVLAIAQRGKHDLRAGCRRREDRVESEVASGTGNRLPPGLRGAKMSAPGRIRTRDPLLRRHIRTVAGRRLASPYEASSWTNHPGVSPCVAGRLPPVAP
jgi:hypothetical protein